MASPEAYDMKMMIDAKRWIVCRKIKNKAKKNLMGIPSITTFMTFIWPINLPPGSGPKNHVIPHVKKLW